MIEKANESGFWIAAEEPDFRALANHSKSFGDRAKDLVSPGITGRLLTRSIELALVLSGQSLWMID